MDKIYWNPEKNDQLKKLRKVTFEDLLNSRFIGTENHPTKKHQNRKYTKKYLGR